MKLRYLSFAILGSILLSPLLGRAQATTSPSFIWWNPSEATFPVLEGKVWPKDTKDFYDRLPARAENKIRKAVWNLSQESAGQMLRFRANSDQIKVRYVTEGRHNLPHMAKTGASGLDLYAISSDGDGLWCAGKFAFGDTIEYHFRNLEPNDAYHKLGREYRLYLPLYDAVKWLEIGIPDSTLFTPLPVRPDLPIVVYGTSIAQGACASRPGMAWPTILSRNMDRPLINLGFSGNGRLEPEVLTMVSEIEAKVYILDCLPNLVNQEDYPLDTVQNRILEAVRMLRQKHPNTPIVLAEHAGYTDEAINPTSRKRFSEPNEVLRQAFAQLQSEGNRELYLIPRKDFNQDVETMVDGTHPNDLGMMRYAEGYEKNLRQILHEPQGEVSTTRPIIQMREPGNYDWDARHREILRMNRENPPEVLMIGNSITHFWGGLPKGPRARGADSWEKVLDPQNTRNLGYGWDRIENVLWRVYHGELDGYAAKQIYVMIGTNNFHLNTDEEILTGWRLLIDAIRQRQPTATLTMVGVYPRRQQEKRVQELNQRLAALTQEMGVKYLDSGKVLLKADGTIDESLFTDGLHPNEEGYRRLSGAYGGK
ncbi:SGNH/GDSL hydrolase family protein [Persicitalea jodogahamensis]|uniref:Acetylhydrolase n=1 Tax=Persicitalea jodogahamensis TaxID=402147 RepID=A0A8J3G824_9BACT|nr:SGNH/GDSL hydrolase family protein [Persicitalea jodogahamensis]GHB61346.1 acetylhydrolase [Persicitalea jodogahamensis]